MKNECLSADGNKMFVNKEKFINKASRKHERMNFQPELRLIAWCSLPEVLLVLRVAAIENGSI